MERTKKIDLKRIQSNLTNNFVKLMPAFYEMESSFLSDVYKRYGDLEGGNIVNFFCKRLPLGNIKKKRERYGL